MKSNFIFTVAVSLALLNSRSFAQERSNNDYAEISREDWQAQVKASRGRAEAMRREHRGLVVQQPTLEEIAERNSRRILEDDSLIPGDIISTNQGMFQFRGAPAGTRRPDDFVRVR